MHAPYKQHAPKYMQCFIMCLRTSVNQIDFVPWRHTGNSCKRRLGNTMQLDCHIIMQYALLWIYGFAPLYAFWVKYLWREYITFRTQIAFLDIELNRMIKSNFKWEQRSVIQFLISFNEEIQALLVFMVCSNLVCLKDQRARNAQKPPSFWFVE